MSVFINDVNIVFQNRNPFVIHISVDFMERWHRKQTRRLCCATVVQKVSKSGNSKNRDIFIFVSISFLLCCQMCVSLDPNLIHFLHCTYVCSCKLLFIRFLLWKSRKLKKKYFPSFSCESINGTVTCGAVRTVLWNGGEAGSNSWNNLTI